MCEQRQEEVEVEVEESGATGLTEIAATLDEVLNLIDKINVGEGENIAIKITGGEREPGSPVIIVDIVDKRYSVGVSEDDVKSSLCRLKDVISKSDALTAVWEGFTFRNKDGIKNIVNPVLILRGC